MQSQKQDDEDELSKYLRLKKEEELKASLL